MKKAFISIPASLVLLLACGLIAVSNVKPTAGPADEPKDKYQVTIDNFSFTPATLTVPAGTTVTWVNRDDVPHTVASDNNKFRSRALDTDEKFSYTLSDPGTYEYYCSIHPKMTGKVVVQ